MSRKSKSPSSASAGGPLAAPESAPTSEASVETRERARQASREVELLAEAPAPLASGEPGAAASSAPEVAPRSTAPVAAPIDDTEAPDLEAIPQSGHSASATTRLRMQTSALRAAAKIESALETGVSRLGGGIESLGEGIGQLGQRVEGIPLVGQGVKDIGGGIADIGQSLVAMPIVAKSASGRALFRSMLVGFALVFAWISAIVWFQLRGGVKPNFRPLAEHILIDIRDGRAATVFAEASPRMQDLSREDRFVADMKDMNQTLGAFVEIVAVNETFVSTGPFGRVGRVSLTIDFARGRTRGSVSFHWVNDRWMLLGLGVEVPATIAITKEQKEARVKNPPELDGLAINLLKRLSAGDDEWVWSQATSAFRDRFSFAEFAELQADRRKALGAFERLLNVEDKNTLSIDALGCQFVGLVQFEHGNALTTITFNRKRLDTPWEMAALKIVLPQKRVRDPGLAVPKVESPPASGASSTERTDRGAVGSAGSGVDGTTRAADPTQNAPRPDVR